MKHKTAAASTVGGASLLTIFGVLCLLVLALLSLSTVLARQRLSQSSLEAVQEYYAADLAAETIFARLRAGELPEAVEQEENRYHFSCPISPGQNLLVTVEQTGDAWQVLRWQAVPEELAQEENLTLWDGQ